MHYIRYDVLYTYVLARIQYWSYQAQIDEGRLLQKLLKAGDRERTASQKKQAAELNKAEKRKAELDRLFASDALDVSTDIDVMQNMLRADGLTDDAPFKL